jgi:hypothetical protein
VLAKGLLFVRGRALIGDLFFLFPLPSGGLTEFIANIQLNKVLEAIKKLEGNSFFFVSPKI